MIKRFYNIIMKLLFNKKSKEEMFQDSEERFLNIISSKEYGDMISKQMSEVKQRAKNNQFIDTREMAIEVPYPYNDYVDYVSFLAEIYEAEDEFWKEIYEDSEADYWINENKNNF